jgi:hypothetical protein
MAGNYGLLNYYGYALFFYHTLNNFAGQTVHLPNRTASFTPHHTAFNASGVAVLPILLGGQLGTLTLTPTAATFNMAFLQQPLSFTKVTVCQHDVAPAGLVLAHRTAVTVALPSPCASATVASASAVVSTPRCTLSRPATGTKWTSYTGAINRSTPSLTECQVFATDHHYCGYEYHAAAGTCLLVPGSACETVAVAGSDAIVGKLACNFSDANATPRVDVAKVATHSATAFFNFSLTPNPAQLSALNSPVYSMLQPSAAACQAQVRCQTWQFVLGVLRIYLDLNSSHCILLPRAQAAAQQACGFLFVTAYVGPPVGSCTAAAKAYAV